MSTEACFTLVGHMSVLISVGSARILTDPWFGPRTVMERVLAPRLVPPALPLESLPPVDAFLVSHGHADHCDDASLAYARNKDVLVVGPRGVARRARALGVARVIALQPSDTATVAGLGIRALRAEHPLASDALCFLLKGGVTVFFSGDTRSTPELRAALCPHKIDVALLQAACAHYPVIGDDGMDLSAAGALAREIHAAWTVPLHLHCVGKWLDRSQGLRVLRDNDVAVQEALRRWVGSVEGEGRRVAILTPGQDWCMPSGNISGAKERLCKEE